MVDPKDGNTVYACAPGKLWSDSDDRGVYKTTDGGKTWTQDPERRKRFHRLLHDDHEFARSRKPCTRECGISGAKAGRFRSGGDGPTAPSAQRFYKSSDGGATWTDLNEKSAQGLPAKPWGRIAVTAAPSNPDVVYALDRIHAQRVVPLGRRRQDLGRTRSQPDDGVAAILFRQSDCGSQR